MQGDFEANPFLVKRRNPLGDIDALQDDTLSNRPFYGQGLPGHSSGRGGGGVRMSASIPRINQFSVPGVAEKALVGSQQTPPDDTTPDNPPTPPPDDAQQETGYSADVFMRSAAKAFPKIQPAGDDNSVFMQRTDTQPTSKIDKGDDVADQARQAAQSEVNRLYQQYQDTISNVGKGSPFLKALSRMYLGYDPDSAYIEKANALMSQYNMARERLSQYMPGQGQLKTAQSGDWLAGIDPRNGNVVWRRRISDGTSTGKENAPHQIAFTDADTGAKMLAIGSHAEPILKDVEAQGPSLPDQPAPTAQAPVIDASWENAQQSRGLAEKRAANQAVATAETGKRAEKRFQQSEEKALQSQIDKARSDVAKIQGNVMLDDDTKKQRMTELEQSYPANVWQAATKGGQAAGKGAVEKPSEKVIKGNGFTARRKD